MTINPNNTTAACSGSDDRHPLLMPDVVLQEARDLHRYWLKENKPYSAGVVADCIATIENLQGRTTQASAPRSASAGVDLDTLAETIHKARWPADRTMAITPFADEDSNGREYCFRIARAVLASNPLEGKGIQSKTEQASSGLRSPTRGDR